ncbi:MAG: phage baseplate protein, partial [Pseudomonadota bacterium]
MAAIFFSPSIGPIEVACILREQHTADTGITSSPVEAGSFIHDHAHLAPKTLSLEVADGQAAATFDSLQSLQAARQPFNVVSGLAVYPNMLIKRIAADRDRTTYNILRATVDLQEVVIANTAIAPIDVDDIGDRSAGEPGGDNSTSAAPVSDDRAGDPTTADRATGTVQRGDVSAKSVPATDS